MLDKESSRGTALHGLGSQNLGSHDMISRENELKCLIALRKLKGVGDATALKLVEHFSLAQNLFNASGAELRSLKLKQAVVNQIIHFDFSEIQPILSWGKQPNCQIIPMNTPYYPPLLSQISRPPLLLFTIGNPEILANPQIAVVGSRTPSSVGIANAQSFCRAMSFEGLTITSGLALGVDGEAHRAALEANGCTVAVAGTGLNRVYPAVHRELAHTIAEKGVLVSEQLPGENYNAGSFPQRNRIIAGLSLGTLVIEAAEKSGTLITARHSMEEGREVFAIPGSIHNPLAKGCHRLIKQGAKLTETIEDILEDIPCITKGQIDLRLEPSKSTLTPELAEFLKYIDYELTTLDVIIRRSGLTVEATTNKLLLLELEGWVINSAGGFIRQ